MNLEHFPLKVYQNNSIYIKYIFKGLESPHQSLTKPGPPRRILCRATNELKMPQGSKLGRQKKTN